MCCNAFVCMSHYLLLGFPTISSGITGFAPLQCRLSVLVKLQAAALLFTQRMRTQAHTDS